MFDWWLELLRSGLDAIQLLTDFSWGWSIVAFTAAVRILILPITIKQTRSMLTMQHVQPVIRQIQQRYKNDRQELQVKLMEFYRLNGINPLASCLPILLQLPIMFGLFFVLRHFSAADQPVYAEMQERADLSFFAGIPDITQDVADLGLPGTGFIIFYVVSQLVSSWVMMSSTQNAQRYIMLALPFVFIPVVVQFPFGLLLFWITTNVWTFGQHLVVTSLIDVDREIIMPTDKKGRQRVIKPRKQGGGEEVRDAPPSEQDTRGDTSNTSGETDDSGRTGHVRPNKRRRKR